MLQTDAAHACEEQESARCEDTGKCGPGVPVHVTVFVCTPVQCLGCRFICEPLCDSEASSARPLENEYLGPLLHEKPTGTKEEADAPRGRMPCVKQRYRYCSRVGE